MRLRDTQRARVYRADNALNGIAPKLPEVHDVEVFVKRVWASRRVAAAYPGAFKSGPPSVADGRGARHARGGVSRIVIPRWARNAGVVIHELSHTITRRHFGGQPAAHGWEFCQVYLDLTLYMLGREAHDALKAAFKKEGVRWRPKKKRAPLSEEKRQELAARLAVARLKRTKGPVPFTNPAFTSLMP